MANTPLEHQDFERLLLELEQSLQSVKARYVQVQADQANQQELQERLVDTKAALKRPQPTPERAQLKHDLEQIQQRLEELEISLESQLFSWRGFQDVFWQAVRFGGLGVVLGWVLRSVAG